PDGAYEVEASSASKEGTDYFVESALVGSKETVDTGLNVNGGTLPLEVTLSAGAGIAEGSVVNEKKEPVPNAVVVAVPEAKFQDRTSRYYRGSTDQNGHFVIRGIRPGNYTLYAWEELEGDDYLDPEFLKRCEGQGTPIKVEKASRQSTALKIVPDMPVQP
ncbi:MAG TPA: carboxypeptidase regulatory-like domain-containing protein, partial [Terriglobales bacterium]|nr:carboxypeptidase regulatory-like domain-containing protein [Terriglobales bacterium]